MRLGYKEPPQSVGVIWCHGGAAGYRPRVQKVTCYSSSSIVCIIFLRRIVLKSRQKGTNCRAVNCPPNRAAAAVRVSGMYMTPFSLCYLKKIGAAALRLQVQKKFLLEQTLARILLAASLLIQLCLQLKIHITCVIGLQNNLLKSFRRSYISPTTSVIIA